MVSQWGFGHTTIQVEPASKEHVYKIKVYGVCNNVDNISSSSKCNLELEKVEGDVYGQKVKIADAKVGMNTQFYMEAYFQLEKSVRAFISVFNKSGDTRYFTDVHYVLIRLK